MFVGGLGAALMTTVAGPRGTSSSRSFPFGSRSRPTLADA
jgi:hypothetical protein